MTRPVIWAVARSGPTANNGRRSSAMQGTRRQTTARLQTALTGGAHLLLPEPVAAERLASSCILGRRRAALDRSDMHGGAAVAKKLHFWAKDDDGTWEWWRRRHIITTTNRLGQAAAAVISGVVGRGEGC